LTDTKKCKVLQAEVAQLQQRLAELEQDKHQYEKREQRLRLMAETIEEVFWMSTPGIKEMLYVSPAYEKIWGMSCDSLYRAPTDFVEAIHPDDKEEVRRAVVLDHSQGKWNCQYRIRRPNGNWRWIEDQGFPVYGSDGELLCLTGVARDVTPQKELEEQLRHSKQMLENIFSSMHIQIAYLDKDFRFIRVNEAYADTVGGKGPDSFVGRGHFDLFPNAENEKIFRRVVTSGVAFHATEKAFAFPDQPQRGTTFWDWSLVPVKKEDGTVYGLLLTLVDVTERAGNRLALEQALAEARGLSGELQQKNCDLEETAAKLRQTQSHIIQQEKLATIGLLAAGVAHEINNPLSFVTSNLMTLGKYCSRLGDYVAALERLLARQYQTESDIGELSELRRRFTIENILADSGDLVDESLEGADRLKNIVRDLKSFSRRDDGQMNMVDINGCLQSTVNIVWSELKYTCELVMDLGDLPPILCHPQQLNQIFMNLLINAAQAMEVQGTITITSRQQAGHVEVSIADTGCGMSPEVAAHIFEPFYTTKPVGKGTGLGLSIAMDIVRHHQGELRVESEPGHGTIFTLRLPIRSGKQ